MTPEFALNLSHDGIGLLYRSAGTWTLLGQVSLDAPDFSEELMDLHARAAKKAEYGVPVTKLIIPASQVLYTTVPVSATEDPARLAEITAALDGLTPYAVEDVTFDWCPSEDPHLVCIAVVARETLREAESFAEDWGFNPASFVAVPAPGAFIGEPWFGQSETVTAQLGAEEGVERDTVPVPLEAAYADYQAKQSDPEEGGAFNLFDAAIASADEPAPEIPIEKPLEDPAKSDALRNLFTLGEDDWSDLDEADLPMPDAERIAQWRAGKPSLPAMPTTHEVLPAPVTAAVPPDHVPAVPVPEIALPEIAAPETLPEIAVADMPLEPVPEIASAEVLTDPIAEVQNDALQEVAAQSAAAPQEELPEAAVIAEEIAAPEKEEIAEELAPPLVAAAGGAARAATPRRLAPRPLGNPPRLGGVSRAAALGAGPARGPGITLPERIGASGQDRVAVAGPGKRGKRAASLAKPEPKIAARPQSSMQLQTNPRRNARISAVDETLPHDGAATPKRVGGKPRYLGILLVALLILCMTIVAALAGTRDDPAPRQSESLSVATPALSSPPTLVRLAANDAVEPTAKGVVLPQGITLFSGRPGKVPPPRPDNLQATPDVTALPVVVAPVDQGADTKTGLNHSPRPTARPTASAKQVAALAVSASDLTGATERAVSVSRRPLPRPRSFKSSIDLALASALASEPVPATMAPAPVAVAAPVQQTIQLPQRTQPQPQAVQPRVQTQQTAVVVRKPDPTDSLDEPEPTEVLRKMPTSASVAKQATQKDALALRDMNLIGLYGSASNRRALVRMPNGRMIKVAVGDILDGGRVTVIGDGQLTYQKGVRLYQLKMLQGS
ncbi:MAG TPA: hypothetical protein VGC31_01560 [Paenirhodobacter sp.]